MDIEARGITNLEIQPVDESTVGFIFTDTSGNRTGFLINPPALRLLLEQGLELAARWAAKPELEVHTFSGPQHALLAQNISLEPGRDERECAVHVYVGDLELTFLAPLDNVVAAAAKMAEMIKAGFIH